MADLRVVNLAGELIIETNLFEADEFGGPDVAGCWAVFLWAA